MSALVAGSSTNRLQGSDTDVESSARCSSGVFVGLLCSSGHGVRSTASTVGDCPSPDGSKGSDRRTTTGQWSFAISGPTIWNSLPAALQAPDSGVQASSVNILV